MLATNYNSWYECKKHFVVTNAVAGFDAKLIIKVFEPSGYDWMDNELESYFCVWNILFWDVPSSKVLETLSSQNISYVSEGFVSQVNENCSQRSITIKASLINKV